MTKTTVTFYYSHRKIGLYLLLNFVLLALAILFSWIIFPDYQPVYVSAIADGIISLLSALIVFVFPMPLAVLDDKQIKIDHNNPLLWSQIKTLEKQDAECFGVNRSILKIIPVALPNYKKSLMQKITNSSRFGMFSIPLYAMDEKAAKEITQLIKEHIKEKKTTKPSAEKTKTTKSVKPAKSAKTKKAAKTAKVAKATKTTQKTKIKTKPSKANSVKKKTAKTKK